MLGASTEVYDEENLEAGREKGHSLLQFAAPIPLPKATTSKLIKSNRMVDVSLDEFLSRGARKFGWLLPGEKVSSCEPTHAHAG